MADIESVVNVSASLVSQALTLDGFKRGLFITADDSVLGTGDNRFRVYQNFKEIEEDFAVGTEPFDAGQIWFARSPLPKPIIMARFITADIAAQLFSAVNTRLFDEFVALTNTTFFDFVVDGETLPNVNPDFTALGSLTAIATAIKTAIDTATASAADVTVVFDAPSSKFIITSGSTGASSTLTFMLPPTNAGFDLGDFMGFKLADGAVLNQGADDQSTDPEQGVLDIIEELNVVVDEELSGGFTFSMFDNAVHDLFTTDQRLSFATSNDALKKFIFAVGDNDAAYETLGNETVFGFRAKEDDITRTFVTYSPTRDYKHVSASGSFSSAINRISLNLKQLPGTTPDFFTDTEIEAIQEKRGNIYTNIATQAAYQDSSSTAENVFIDVWVDVIQVELELKENVFNFIFEASQINSDVPFTDEGSISIQNVIEQTMTDAVNRGVFAKGAEVSDAMKAQIIAITGKTNFSGVLSKGFLVDRRPVSTASATQRANREYPVFTVWAVSSGTIQSVQIQLFVVQ